VDPVTKIAGILAYCSDVNKAISIKAKAKALIPKVKAKARTFQGQTKAKVKCLQEQDKPPPPV